MSNSNTFNWPAYPANETEFESLMQAMDSNLEQKGLKPAQRPLHIGILLWEAFKWEGLLLPSKELANKPEFTGDTLMAKSYRWYEQVYGEKLKLDLAIGYVPVKIANGVWKVKLPVIYGACSFFIDRNLANRGNTGIQQKGTSSINLLCLVEDLPVGLIERLPDSELSKFFDNYMFSFNTLSWREGLKGHIFFNEAYNDYSSSTDELLKQHFAQSRWASAQAVEKTLKGLLALGNKSFSKGADGHDIVKLGVNMKNELGVDINPNVLALAMCSPKVRYGEEPSNSDQALLANHATLEVLSQLSKSKQIKMLLTANI